ncbi:MAG: trimethylamine methyltransferase family protein, partial [Deltaproteobacteria bacterium]|nr:trimethylamine methyltransferase family protein [Deltaproteobacteria bacterium]
LGDRLQPTLWEELGAQDIRERARANVQQILSTHYPNYIDPAVDAKIRDAYNIVLDPEAITTSPLEKRSALSKSHDFRLISRNRARAQLWIGSFREIWA